MVKKIDLVHSFGELKVPDHKGIRKCIHRATEEQKPGCVDLEATAEGPQSRKTRLMRSSYKQSSWRLLL